jgi:hypothetical protein
MKGPARMPDRLPRVDRANELTRLQSQWMAAAYELLHPIRLARPRVADITRLQSDNSVKPPRMAAGG